GKRRAHSASGISFLIGSSRGAACQAGAKLTFSQNVTASVCSEVRAELLVPPRFFTSLYHSSLMPANLITLAHFSVSSAISLLKSAGEPTRGVPPRSASLAFILRSPRPALISLLSLSMISDGVFLGTPMPYHWLASCPGPEQL